MQHKSESRQARLNSETNEYTNQKFSHFHTRIHFIGTRHMPSERSGNKNVRTNPSMIPTKATPLGADIAKSVTRTENSFLPMRTVKI